MFHNISGTDEVECPFLVLLLHALLFFAIYLKVIVFKMTIHI